MLFLHWLILTASEIDAEKGDCRFQSNLSENSRKTQQHRREGHFPHVSDAEASSPVLPASSQWLTSATDAPHVRWDCSPTGSAGLAYPQSRPGYPDQLPPQSSGFAVPSTPHCSGSLSGFKNLPGYFLSHVVFHSLGMRERGWGKQCLRKRIFPVFFFFLSGTFQGFP